MDFSKKLKIKNSHKQFKNMRKFRVKLERKVDHMILVSVKYLYWLSCNELFSTSQKDPSYVAIHVSSDGICLYKYNSLEKNIVSYLSAPP